MAAQRTRSVRNMFPSIRRRNFRCSAKIGHTFWVASTRESLIGRRQYRHISRQTLSSNAIKSTLVRLGAYVLPKKIGVIGANGQVGSEVCLLLSQIEGIQPVPVCRSQVGASFLRRCGLDVRLGTADNEANSRKLLEDLDLVADFSLPTGSSSYVRSQITQTVSNVARFASPEVPFVYLSS